MCFEVNCDRIQSIRGQELILTIENFIIGISSVKGDRFLTSNENTEVPCIGAKIPSEESVDQRLPYKDVRFSSQLTLKHFLGHMTSLKLVALSRLVEIFKWNLKKLKIFSSVFLEKLIDLFTECMICNKPGNFWPHSKVICDRSDKFWYIVSYRPSKYLITLGMIFLKSKKKLFLHTIDGGERLFHICQKRERQQQRTQQEFHEILNNAFC